MEAALEVLPRLRPTPFEPAHLQHLELVPYRKASHEVSPTEGQRYAGNGPAIALITPDGRAMAIFGVFINPPEVPVAFGWLDWRCGAYMHQITTWSQALLAECGLRRIEARIPPRLTAGMRWLQCTGFRRDAEHLWFRKGKPFFIFTWKPKGDSHG
jgi:hypothetical protein